jgi:hypothetical protein
MPARNSLPRIPTRNMWNAWIAERFSNRANCRNLLLASMNPFPTHENGKGFNTEGTENTEKN